MLHNLNEWLANYSLQAKFSSLPVFVNESFLEHSMSVCFHVIYSHFQATVVELSGCNSDKQQRD